MSGEYGLGMADSFRDPAAMRAPGTLVEPDASGIGGLWFLRQERAAPETPEEIGAQEPYGQAALAQQLLVAGRVQEIEKDDAAARLQHAHEFGNRLVARCAPRDVVDHRHRDGRVERRVGERQARYVAGLHFD